LGNGVRIEGNTLVAAAFLFIVWRLQIMSSMNANTKDDILKKAKVLELELIHLQFTDITGTMKNVSIPIEELEKALNNEMDPQLMDL
jgi:hypothetical protein